MGKLTVQQLHKKNEIFFGTPFRDRLIRHPIQTLFVVISRKIIQFLISLGAPDTWKARLFWGDEMTVKMPQGFALWQYGFLEGYELSLTQFIVDTVSRGGIFFDIGAHDGYYTLLASHLVGDSGKVYSFEPTPSMHDQIKKIFDTKPNIVLTQTALGKSKGEAELLDFGYRSGSNTLLPAGELLSTREDLRNAPYVRRKVPLTTVDAFCGDAIAPTFLQIDTEGTEYDILRGGEEIIQKYKPIIAIEVWKATIKSGTYQNIIDYMAELTYMPYALLKDGHVIPETDHQSIPSSTVIFLPKKPA